MAWRSPEGGIGGFNAGFDTSGGETWQQAATVGPGQKGVYEGYTSFNPFDFHPRGGGTRLTPGGMDVNKAVQDWQNWRTTNDPIYGNIEDLDIGTQKHIYKENLLRDFETTYPGASGLGMTADDVYKQQLLDEEASEDYRWLAGGGIASLKNRPGYGWGGLSALGKLFGNGKAAKASQMANWDYEPSWRGPRTRTDAGEFTDAPGGYTEMTSSFFPSKTIGGDDARNRINWEGEFGEPRMAGKATYPLVSSGQYPDEGKEEPTPFNTLLPWENRLYGWQGGGAVGLEPGIGSLMGYAKGGMVTRVKVPKGQSKWMKKFMNNMRDS